MAQGVTIPEPSSLVRRQCHGPNGETMTHNNVSHRSLPVSTNRTDGLLFLLRYAMDHAHSHLWIGAIQIILSRRGGTHA
jgi:hypothetical protein